jgi:hypothetical protein
MVDAKSIKEANRKAFLDVFPQLTKEVLDELRKYNMPEDAYEWTKQVQSIAIQQCIRQTFANPCFMC